MSLDAFGVKNLRCLTDTGLVPIRPITVLVGRNSSGKSTFLRAFPLLRQSVETARNSPILWYRQGNVDFGSLQDAANNRLREPNVSFRFRLRLPESANIAIGDPLFDITMTLAGVDKPYVQTYDIAVAGHTIHLSFDAQGLLTDCLFNDRHPPSNRMLYLGSSDKTYLIASLQDIAPSPSTYEARPELLYLDPIHYKNEDVLIFIENLINALIPLFHGNASSEQIWEAAIHTRIGERSKMLQHLASISWQQVFKARAKTLDVADDEFGEIVDAILAHLTPYILEAADLVITQFMSQIAYLAPLRVSPERSYRIQNLAINEIDPDGNNLPMFLRSLSPDETASFAHFTREALGFETSVKTVGHHAEILIKAGTSGRFVNLVDVGFGYAEVLPLAATLWASCVRTPAPNRERASLIAIEQPELHLHPAYQAKLARMFVEAVRASGGASKILLETHSETLINGLGKLVYDGVIKAEDIQIALFDQDEETGETTVTLAGYRDNGALHDWPYGFLSPIAERRSPPRAAE